MGTPASGSGPGTTRPRTALGGRRARAAVLVITVLSAAACTSTDVVSGATRTPPPTSSPAGAAPRSPVVPMSGTGVDPHLAAARSDAAALLALVPVPPGARPSSAVPGGVTVLEAPPSQPGSSYVVDLAAWWTAPGAMDSVIAWVQAHGPVGTTTSGRGSSSVRGLVAWEATGWSFADVGPALTDRQLSVMVAPDGAGSVALRADAQVVWAPVRAPGSLVGALAVESATVTQLPGSDGSTGTTTAVERTVTVTDTATVRRIVTTVDALPVDANTVMSCPAFSGRQFRVDFIGPGGVVVATVSGNEAQCGGYALTVAGVRQAPVRDPLQALFDLVVQTLGPDAATAP